MIHLYIYKHIVLLYYIYIRIYKKSFCSSSVGIYWRGEDVWDYRLRADCGEKIRQCVWMRVKKVRGEVPQDIDQPEVWVCCHGNAQVNLTWANSHLHQDVRLFIPICLIVFVNNKRQLEKSGNYWFPKRENRFCKLFLPPKCDEICFFFKKLFWTLN